MVGIITLAALRRSLAIAPLTNSYRNGSSNHANFEPSSGEISAIAPLADGFRGNFATRGRTMRQPISFNLVTKSAPRFGCSQAVGSGTTGTVA